MEKIGNTIKDMQEMGEIPREIKNEAERQLYRELISQGWSVTKRGWPDFACFKGNNLALVEVKPKQSRRLKKEQWRLMSALAKLGVKCFRWSPDGGFQPIVPSVPDLSPRQLRKLKKLEQKRGGEGERGI